APHFVYSLAESQLQNNQCDWSTHNLLMTGHVLWITSIPKSRILAVVFFSYWELAYERMCTNITLAQMRGSACSAQQGESGGMNRVGRSIAAPTRLIKVRSCNIISACGTFKFYSQKHSGPCNSQQLIRTPSPKSLSIVSKATALIQPISYCKSS
ncbi:hypothetical protein COCCADRAFT_111363, partial [Bipolaris zeicola 26-R-13]